MKAEREVYHVTDPRAVPAIFKTFGSGSERMQQVAVELLSQIDGPTSSFCLLAMAMGKPSSEVRDRAARALALRDPRDVIGWLIRLVRKPFKYEVKPGNGPGTTGVLFVEGERFDIRRLYRFPDVEVLYTSPIDVARATGTEVPLIEAASAGSSPAQRQSASMARELAREFLAHALMGEALRRDAAVQQTLENDVQTIEAMNAQIEQTNSRALPLLATLTGQNFGADPQQWQAWWADQLGLVVDDRYADSKPVLSDFVGASRRRGSPPRLLRRRNLGSNDHRPAENRIARRRRSRPGSEYNDWWTLIPARAGHALERTRRNVPDHDRRRNDRRHRNPPLLESRQRLDHGTRPERRRSPPHDRRRGRNSVDRA